MLEIQRHTTEIEATELSQLPSDAFSNDQPLLIRGLVNNWELAKAGMQSAEEAVRLLKGFYNGREAGVYFGEPEIAGRFFYDDTASRLNFTVSRGRLDEALDKMLQYQSDTQPPSVYITSNVINSFFPGLQDNNALRFQHPYFDDEPFQRGDPLVSIWIGNKTLVSCHFDAPQNIACSVVGKRRFSLFPPDQIANLYPGPLEPTPGGQVISMVDFHNPDLEKFPRFAQAVQAGQIAELEAGDALFIPSMWWHQVESLTPFNVLINYWWNTSPKFMAPGKFVLDHAFLGLRDRPKAERMAWKAVFDYYIFGEQEQVSEHLPEAAAKQFAQLDELSARQLRAKIINNLNR